jgi:geranylgeranyl reductase family protein
VPNIFEVGIVGAGVAGSSCAQVLGRAGVKVAIFDNSHPREKPCGGLIEDRVVDEFDIPEEFLENEIRWVLTDRFKFRVKLFFKPSMFLISRENFDYYLLQRALENKSVAFFDEKVSQVIKKENGWILKTSKDRCVKVKVLVGADGCPSLVRKHVSRPIPPQFLATTIGYSFPCSSKYMEKAFAKNTVEAYYSHEYVQKGGFIWIFPKRTSINVGIGSIETGKKLKQSLDKFILLHSAGKRLKLLEGHFFTHLVPAIWMDDFFDVPCSGGNWALIGDAAGHVNAIGGAGIYYALKGGMLCGLAFLDGDLNLFERYWRKEYGDELYHGAKAVLTFYSNLGFFLWLKYIFENFLCQLRFC